jgi:hypothetical protein
MPGVARLGAPQDTGDDREVRWRGVTVDDGRHAA